MMDHAEHIRALLTNGTPFTLATIVGIQGSSPRPLGTSMVIVGDEDDPAHPLEVVGDLSGGCVETEVIAQAHEAARDGRARRVEFGISDAQGMRAGLTCGGVISTLIAPVRPGTDLERELREAFVPPDGTGEVSLVVAGPEEALGRSPRLNPDLCALPGVETLTFRDRAQLKLVIFGAEGFARALSDAASLLGWDVTVVDPRPVFTAAGRFPSADRIMTCWPTDFFERVEPDGRTAVCVLSHDSRYQLEVIAAALASDAFYVGAMGSRRTHERRMRGLREAGVDERALARLRSPIGLDLGAGLPEETAVSILAEILQVRSGATGLPLSRTRGSIHDARPSQP